MARTAERTANYRQIPQRLAQRQPFRGNSMSAVECADASTIPTGRLADEHRQQLRCSGAVYVVYSYGTPIAWVTSADDVVVPEARYSVTTSRQQGLCRAWL